MFFRKHLSFVRGTVKVGKNFKSIIYSHFTVIKKKDTKCIYGLDFVSSIYSSVSLAPSYLLLSPSELLLAMGKHCFIWKPENLWCPHYTAFSSLHKQGSSNTGSSFSGCCFSSLNPELKWLFLAAAGMVKVQLLLIKLLPIEQLLLVRLPWIRLLLVRMLNVWLLWVSLQLVLQLLVG
jgi:hypothetical protein